MNSPQGRWLPGFPQESQPFINGWLSIGWLFSQSLHRKCLEITKHPSIYKWLGCLGFQVSFSFLPQNGNLWRYSYPEDDRSLKAIRDTLSPDTKTPRMDATLSFRARSWWVGRKKHQPATRNHDITSKIKHLTWQWKNQPYILLKMYLLSKIRWIF